LHPQNNGYNFARNTRSLCYIDASVDEEEHLRRLEEVLCRLQEHGIRVKKNKCFFMMDSVEFLGHGVDAEGIHALPEKIRAVEQAPLPKNVHQLRSILTYFT
jgi:hypothetical protein